MTCFACTTHIFLCLKKISGLPSACHKKSCHESSPYCRKRFLKCTSVATTEARMAYRESGVSTANLFKLAIDCMGSLLKRNATEPSYLQQESEKGGMGKEVLSNLVWFFRHLRLLT